MSHHEAKATKATKPRNAIVVDPQFLGTFAKRGTEAKLRIVLEAAGIPPSTHYRRLAACV